MVMIVVGRVFNPACIPFDGCDRFMMVGSCSCTCTCTCTCSCSSSSSSSSSTSNTRRTKQPTIWSSNPARGNI